MIKKINKLYDLKTFLWNTMLKQLNLILLLFSVLLEEKH